MPTITRQKIADALVAQGALQVDHDSDERPTFEVAGLPCTVTGATYTPGDGYVRYTVLVRGRYSTLIAVDVPAGTPGMMYAVQAARGTATSPFDPHESWAL